MKILLLLILAGEPWLPRLQSFLAQHHTFQASFTEILQAAQSPPETLQGRLFVQAPDRIRLETPQMVLVQRGQQGEMLDRSTGQVSSYRSLGSSPLVLFTLDSLQAYFAIQETDTAVVLVPRDRPTDTLWVVPGPDGAPQRLEYHSPQQVLRFRFGPWHTDRPLNPDRFRLP